MTSTRPSQHLIRAVILPLIVFLLSGPEVAAGKPSGDTTVYHAKGKGRVHVAECRRYKRLSDKEKAAMTEMTLEEAEKKGLPLCSRCPGSTTAGKGNPEKGGGGSNLPESWVKPGPAEISKATFTPSERAPLISLGEDGKLVYQPFSDKGDRLLDWSTCGYQRSEVPIPDVAAVETLTPPAGETKPEGQMKYPMGPDSRGLIQGAIDQVAAQPAGTDGFKGAVLLKKGTWYVGGPLSVKPGVVLRGEGDGEDGTVLIMKSSKAKETAIRLGGEEGIIAPEAPTAVRIADAYVPTGTLRLNLKGPHPFQAGDFVHVKKTVNDQWIKDLGMGERLRHIRGGKEGAFKKPWKPEAYQFRILRQITAVDGNTITLDLMLPQSFDEKHGGGEVYKVDHSQVGSHAGLENLRIVSNYDTTVKDTGKDANFKNFRSGISVSNLRDGWVRNCTVLHVSFACVNLSNGSSHITVRDCQYLQPIGPKRGGNRYSFSIGGGTGHLVYNCYSEDARHCFAGGSREQGPFAFVKCTSVRGGQSEPHHRWGTGFLYDHITTKDGVLAAINRGDSGSGHGWAAANTLIWNGDAKNIVVFDPETEGENNFAIGFRGAVNPEGYETKGLMYANNRAGYWGTPQEGKYYGYALMGSGHIESPDKPVEPASLFTQQLIERIGAEQAAQVLE
jgi:hypothetical protein